jgi:hypothetical protein
LAVAIEAGQKSLLKKIRVHKPKQLSDEYGDASATAEVDQIPWLSGEI